MDRNVNDQMKGKGCMGSDPSTSVVDNSPAKAAKGRDSKKVYGPENHTLNNLENQENLAPGHINPIFNGGRLNEAASIKARDSHGAWFFYHVMAKGLPEFIDLGKLGNRFIVKRPNGGKTIDAFKLLSLISFALKEDMDISASAEDAVYCARVTRASWNPEAQLNENPDAEFLCKAKALVEAQTHLDPDTYAEPLPLLPRKKGSMSKGSVVSGRVIKKKPRRKPTTRTPSAKGVGRVSGMLAGGKSPVVTLLSSLAAILNAQTGAAAASLTPQNSRNAQRRRRKRAAARLANPNTP